MKKLFVQIVWKLWNLTSVKGVPLNWFMSKSKTSVIQSDFSEYFSHVNNSDIYLLDKSVAEDIWDKRIHKGSSSYFRLPDDCWLHTMNSVKLS